MLSEASPAGFGMKMRLPDDGSAEYVDVIRDLADRYNRNSPWPHLSPLHRQPEQNVDDPDTRRWAGAIEDYRRESAGRS